MSETVKFLKRDKKTVYWESVPGVQTKMLLSKADETLAAGQRGSGMTQGLLAWMVMGDLTLPKDDPAHYSYAADPSYRGLLLLRSYHSINDYCDEMHEMWGPLGAKIIQASSAIRFPSGAKIFVGNTDILIREWVFKRFVEVKDNNGNVVKPGRMMRPESGPTRLYLPMKLSDNPYLRDNRQYVGIMECQDELTRRAWMQGDWSAFLPEVCHS